MSVETGQEGLAEDFIGNPAPFLSFETTAGATHSLTTVANQRVIVWAKGDETDDGAGGTVVLSYNGVQKDVVGIKVGSTQKNPFALMYTEIPGAGTHDITVTETGSTTLSNVVIMVCKLLVG